MRANWIAVGMLLGLLTASGQVFRADVDLVQLECSATKDGRPVLDMRQQDFVLLDNGKPRPVEHVWRENDLPLIVGLIADVSGSQSPYVVGHRQAIAAFLQQVLRPRDRAFVVSVGGQVRLLVDLTSSADALQAGVERVGDLPATGTLLGYCPPWRSSFALGVKLMCTTALWNGIYFAALREMNGLTGRKAFVVLTDGEDRHSPHSLTDAIEAAQGNDTRVYTIQYPGFMGAGNPIAGIINARGAASLRRLAAETGGLAFRAPSGDPSGIFSQIEEELRTMYVLGFRLPERSRDGKPHNLEARSSRRGVEVRARKKYVGM